MKHLRLFENFDQEDNELYFYIEDGSKKAIVRIAKEGSKWQEYLERGEAPYGFGGKTYQSYLEASDIISWLNKDYDYVEQIQDDQFDEYLGEDEEPALRFYTFPDDLSDADFTAVTASGKVYDIYADGRVERYRLDGMALSEFLEDSKGPIELDELPDNIKDIVNGHQELKESVNEGTVNKVSLSADDEKKLAKDFTVDGKYAFDSKLSDEEKEALLMQKVEDIIKKKNLNPGQADKVRKTWKDNIKKVGVGQFEDELKRRWLAADKRLTGGRLQAAKEKIKGEIWKGYKQPVALAFDNLADIITGEY